MPILLAAAAVRMHFMASILSLTCQPCRVETVLDLIHVGDE